MHIHRTCFLSVLLLSFACAPASDKAVPHTPSVAHTKTPRNYEAGDEGNTTASEPTPMPTPDASCACDPKGPDTCPIGTDCVPYGDQDDLSNYFCLAKCSGTNELGGSYVTDCRNDQGTKVGCQYAEGHGPDGYCPKCLRCSDRPHTFYCEG